MGINYLQPMEEIKEPHNCITKAFENHPIFIFKEEKNNKKQYWFKGSDIANALEISNLSSSIQNFSEKEKGLRKVETLGGDQNVIFLTSRGIYRLLYNSKKEKAAEFREWVGDILDDIIFNESKELKRKLEENDKKLKQTEIALEKQTELLQQKTNDNRWLHNISKQQISFLPFSEKIVALYIGNNKVDSENFLEKIGKSINPNFRKTCLSTGTSPEINFNVYKQFQVFKGMELATESYTHALLKPFNIRNKKSSKEYFMIHRKIAEEIVVDVIKYQNKVIKKINNYIELLDQHNFNFEMVASILDKNCEEKITKIEETIDDKYNTETKDEENEMDDEEINDDNNLENDEETDEEINDDNNLENDEETDKEINDDNNLENDEETDEEINDIYFDDQEEESDEESSSSEDTRKLCTHCNRNLPVKKHFLFLKEKQRYKTKCKKCMSELSKKYRSNLKNDPSYGKKECISCKELLKYDLFYKCEQKDEYYDICRICYDKDNTEKHKQCRTCNRIKTTGNFYKDKWKPDGLDYDCKECKSKKVKEKYKNKEKVECTFCKKVVVGIQMKRHQETKACKKFQVKQILENNNTCDNQELTEI